MKVLLVNGSSHVKGTTMRAVEEMQKIFASCGIDTQVFQLGGNPLRDCIQCNSCRKTGECVFKDDGVNEFVRLRPPRTASSLRLRYITLMPAAGFFRFLTGLFTAPAGIGSLNSSPAPPLRF